MNDLSLTNIAITASSELIKQSINLIMTKWVSPKLEALKRKRDVDTKFEEYILDGLPNYFKRIYDTQIILDVMALGNQQVNLKQVYVPLTLSSEERREDHQVNEFDESFVDKYKYIIIEDTAGMGKTTVMKKLFTSAFEKNSGIPVFIELRRLTEGIGIMEIIIEDINPLKPMYNVDLIIELLETGNFIFFLDGFDEIPFEHKEYVIRHLKQFITKTNKNTFFITSRSDDSLVSFGQFQRFEIKDLVNREAYELIRKYDAVCQLNLADSLIEQINKNIKNKGFDDLQSFLGNPLLVSLLYLTFRHRRDIPNIKSEFYRKVYDALYDEHDLSKNHFKRDTKSGLSNPRLHEVLRSLGSLCMMENNNDYGKDELLKLIKQSIRSPYLNDVQDKNVFDDLIEAVPLFIKQGLNYKWAHKSFMEYFTAQHIFIDRSNEKEDILKNIWKSSNFTTYLNVLDLYYDVDRRTFDRVLVYPILNDFLKFFGKCDPENLELIEYKQWIFNRLYFYDCKIDPIEEETFIEVTSKIKSELGAFYPQIENFSLIKLQRDMTSNYSAKGIMVKDTRVEAIMRILNSKGSNLIKPLPKVKPLKMVGLRSVFGMEDDISNLTRGEIFHRLEVMKDTSRSLNRRMELGCFDYFAVLQYKQLIENEIKHINSNPFVVQ